MAKIFFSHASEDKVVVEAVYDEFVATHPDHQPWVDKYEIVGGDSLLEKIASGMDESERFFIFLSSLSITKPWVQRELRRAVMREINDVDPNYIVPVKIGELNELPPFLEDKYYIDLGKLTKEQWIAEFDAAITGTPARPETAGGDANLQYQMGYGPEGHNVAHIRVSVRAWAEKFSVAVETNEDMVIGQTGLGAIPEFEVLVGTSFTLSNPRFLRQPRLLGIRFDQPELRPGEPIVVRVEFPPGIDALGAIEHVSRLEVTPG